MSPSSSCAQQRGPTICASLLPVQSARGFNYPPLDCVKAATIEATNRIGHNYIEIKIFVKKKSPVPCGTGLRLLVIALRPLVIISVGGFMP